jgi:hypothetical protein
MKKIKVIAIFSLCIMLFASCSKGGKFEGKWKQINGRDHIEITKSGDNFLIQGGGKKISATLVNDEKLSINSMFGSVYIVYDGNSKHILIQDQEYEKE